MARHLNRRAFLGVVGLGGAATLLAACSSAAPAPTAAPPAVGAGGTAVGAASPAASPAAPAAAASPSPAASAAGNAAPANVTSHAQVTLNMLAIADPVYLAAFQAVVAAFKASENGKWSYVDVSFDTAPVAQLYPKIETSVATGATWDILQADGPQVKHYAFNKAIRPMQEFYSADELKQWVQPSIIEGSYKGTLYAPPMMQSASVLFFNQDLIQSTGVNPPQTLDQSWTTDQALDAWQKATQRPSPDATPTVFGIWPAQGDTRSDYIAGIFRRGAGAKTSNAFKGLADDGITATGYVDADEAIQGMQFYQDLGTKYKISPVQPIPNIFPTKKAAYQISPDNEFGVIQQQYPNGGFNLSLTGIPKFPNGTQMTQTGSWHWGLAPNTKHQDEAVAFIRFAAGKDGAQAIYKVIQQIPAQVDLLNSLPEYKAFPKKLVLDSLVNIGVPRVQTPGYQEFQTIILDADNNIAQGAPVADTLHAAAKNIDTALAKYKGWNQ